MHGPINVNFTTKNFEQDTDIYIYIYIYLCLIKLFILKKIEDVNGKVQALLSSAMDGDQCLALIRREVPRYPLDVRLDSPHCQIECADEENSH
jgi:hypothetical protein